MTSYIIQTISFQLFFLLVYETFLKRETFFNCNRAYLLLSSLLSFLLPLIKIDAFKNSIPHEYAVKLPTSFVVEANSVYSAESEIATSVGETTAWQWDWIMLIYIGMLMSFLLLCFKLNKLIKLYRNNPHSNFKRTKIINLKDSHEAFSFLRLIFLGSNIKHGLRKAIIKHELIHIKEYHSLDLLYFELLKVIFWFNPLIYIYRFRLMELHEFIADSKSVIKKGKKHHYQSLLNQVFQTNSLSFVNQFFSKSLIKKRIMMLNKNKSERIKLLKYSIMCPLVLGMLFYVSCEQESFTNQSDSDISSLDQYSYSLKKEEEMTPQLKNVHNKYEEFLKNNPDYVSWVDYDFTDEAAYFTVHPKDKEVPMGFHEVTLNFPNEENYKSYIDFGIKNSKAIVKLSIDDADETILPKLAIRDRQNWSNRIEPTIIVAKKNNLNENQYSNEFGQKELLEAENSKNDFLNTINKVEEQTPQILEIPWPVVDEVPLFSGCEKLSEAENKTCTDERISEFIHSNFNKALARKYNFNDDKRINVIFKIDTNGNVISVRARAKHPALEDEAIRVVKSMPQFNPGIYENKKVVVPYGLPIVLND